jgi:hypothetical protein
MRVKDPMLHLVVVLSPTLGKAAYSRSNPSNRNNDKVESRSYWLPATIVGALLGYGPAPLQMCPVPI